MIRLRRSKEEELKAFFEMEKQPHAQAFVNGSDLLTHQQNFKDRNIIYLSIENNMDELVGYFILALNSNENGVEFRRVLIDQHHRGVGQRAIIKMEAYCREELNASSIWLDVYDDNVKGKYIYKKLGYKQFKEACLNERKLLYFKKEL